MKNGARKSNGTEDQKSNDKFHSKWRAYCALGRFISKKPPYTCGAIYCLKQTRLSY